MSGRSVTASARADETGATARRRRPPLAPTLRRAVALLGGLFLFVGALQLMKTGAGALGVLQPGSVLVENALSTLGLGWLGALTSSRARRSPRRPSRSSRRVRNREAPAAFGLEGFTMLTGSRLGAAFVVLVVGVIYAARRPRATARAGLHRRPRTRRRPPSSTCPPPCSAPASHWEPYAGLEPGFPAGFIDLIDFVYGDIVEWAKELPAFVTFLAGIGVLLLAFKLIDTALPDLDDDRVARRPAWLRRKWPMFALGSAVALVTMSVSVALTVLVPLVAKKMVRQEYVLPYIMGANITTLGDTMLAAFALDSPAAVRVVLAEVIAAGSLSILLLALAYPTVWSALWGMQTAITRSRTRLAVFTLGVLLVPVLTIALAAVIG